MSMLELQPTYHSFGYSWRIPGFSLKKQKLLIKLIPPWTDFQHICEWTVSVYPSYRIGKDSNYVAIILICWINDNMAAIATSGSLSILTALGTQSFKKEFRCIFTPDKWTCPEKICISHVDMHRNRPIYLPDDTLTVICELYAIQPKQSPDLTIGLASLRMALAQFSFSDVIVEAGDAFSKAHKILLSAASPVLDSLLKDLPSRCNVLSLQKADEDILSSLITYIYTRKVSNLPQQCVRLFIAASMYEMPHLKRMCSDAIHRTWNYERAVEVRNWAEHFNCLELYQMFTSLKSLFCREISASSKEPISVNIPQNNCVLLPVSADSCDQPRYPTEYFPPERNASYELPKQYFELVNEINHEFPMFNQGSTEFPQYYAPFSPVFEESPLEPSYLYPLNDEKTHPTLKQNLFYQLMHNKIDNHNNNSPVTLFKTVHSSSSSGYSTDNDGEIRPEFHGYNVINSDPFSPEQINHPINLVRPTLEPFKLNPYFDLCNYNRVETARPIQKKLCNFQKEDTVSQVTEEYRSKVEAVSSDVESESSEDDIIILLYKEINNVP